MARLCGRESGHHDLDEACLLSLASNKFSICPSSPGFAFYIGSGWRSQLCSSVVLCGGFFSGWRLDIPTDEVTLDDGVPDFLSFTLYPFTRGSSVLLMLLFLLLLTEPLVTRA